MTLTKQSQSRQAGAKSKYLCIYEILGIIYQKKKEFAKALYYYQRELRINPKACNSLFNYGILLLKKGETRKAVKYLEILASIGPSDQCLLLLAQAYQNLGRINEAIIEYNKLDSLKLQDKKIPYNLGICLMCNGDNASAIKEFKIAIKLDESFISAWGNIGIALKREGRHQEALEATKKVLDLDPQNSTAHMNLAIIYKELGQLDRALASTLKSLELNQDNPDAYVNLGSIYKELGQLDQALASTLSLLS